ncbi:MAG: hypothetical protein HYX80_04845, partial [Chloroflexi bacterium]|nr:hypothetical protein [Chloroflexota bacterium]
MKNKWQVIVGLVLSLAVMLTGAAPVLAQEDKPAETEGSSARSALAIIAPWAVPVNKEFTARVFLRENQEPFPGAGVWAIDIDTAERLKDELGELKEDSNRPDAERDYESILEKHAIFLGRTGDDGRVAHAFKQAGGYILVAAKNGYLPGITRIRVGENIKALGIKAPKRAPVGEEVTIGVFARLTQEAVEGAGVWAVSRDRVEALQQ